MKQRCHWCTQDPLYINYHDNEWGIPLHDDNKLFELLILEGMQAGLNWFTILNKRENFRQAFANFDPHKVARYSDKQLEKLMQNSSIIRHRGKLASAINNAKLFIKLQQEWHSFDHYIWHFTDGKPIQNHWKTQTQVPAKTPLSDTLSKDLKKRGFKFVGTTICYAYMQAIGIVNDHITSCFRYSA